MKIYTCILVLGTMPATAAQAGDAATALTELEARYAGDRAVCLRLVLARYADELTALQQQLLQAGDASGAARVQLECDRLVPALGLPAAATEDADEFGAFEDVAPVPLLPQTAPVTLPADLDGILKTLLPAAPASAPAATPGQTRPASSSGNAGKGGRRFLRMSGAQLQGTYDPLYGYIYWSGGRSASWTLNDLPPGTYQLQLRYTCDDKLGGGKLKATFGASTVEAEVASTGNWKRKRDLVIGPFEIKESRADLILQPSSLRPNAAYLMDLAALLVVPVAAPPP